jgi:hypothetical protein
LEESGPVGVSAFKNLTRERHQGPSAIQVLALFHPHDNSAFPWFLVVPGSASDFREAHAPVECPGGVVRFPNLKKKSRFLLKFVLEQGLGYSHSPEWRSNGKIENLALRKVGPGTGKYLAGNQKSNYPAISFGENTFGGQEIFGAPALVREALPLNFQKCGKIVRHSRANYRGH